MLLKCWRQMLALLHYMKTNGEKPGNLPRFCPITIFIWLLYLITFTADVGLLTTIDYYDWLLFHGRISGHTEHNFLNIFQSDNLQLQVTIRPCQQQKNGVDCRIYAVLRMHFKISSIEVFCRGFVQH